MKHTRKKPLWYNPKAGDTRRELLERSGLTDLAADKEGRALLESYYRMYRDRL